MNLFKVFALALAVVGLYDAKLLNSNRKTVEDLTVNEIADGIKVFCRGKTNGFCSKKQLNYFKMILKEKADQKKKEIENKIIEKNLEKMMKEEVQRKSQERIRHNLQLQKMKILRDLNELFLRRNF